MPITPLHFGVLAPINHWIPNKVSNLSFILVTLWLDANAILYYAFGISLGEFHSPATHSVLGVVGTALIVAVCNIKNVAWIIGAFLGGVTHLLLDSMVHAEILPFYPAEGNPFFWGGMFWVSLALLVPMLWLIFQYVSYTLDWVKRRQAD